MISLSQYLQSSEQWHHELDRCNVAKHCALQCSSAWRCTLLWRLRAPGFAQTRMPIPVPPPPPPLPNSRALSQKVSVYAKKLVGESDALAVEVRVLFALLL